ncbi:hypothetical protein GVAV_001341 [Gurleya vavrai]
MFLLLITSIRLAISEEKLQFGFIKPNEIKASKFKRAIIRDDHIELRSSANGGSIITFEDANPVDDWAIEFDINLLNLSFPQRAGFYVWYTDHEMLDGSFNGSDGRFNGIMMGLEIVGKSVFLVMSNNDKEYDYSLVDDHNITTAVDSINPARFRNIKNIKMKIISTSKNFRVELYDESGKLLYDNFRYVNLDGLGDLKNGKNFSITTTYEKTPLSKHFNLKGVRLYERKEEVEYDPYKVYSKLPDENVRWSHHIDHPNKEVRHLIANIDNFIRYIKGMIGQPAGLTIFKGLFDTHYEMQLYEKKIEEIQEEIKKKENIPVERIESVIKKFEGIKESCDYIDKSIEEIEYFLRLFEEKHDKRINYVVLIILMGVVGFVVFLIVQFLIGTKIKKLID